MFVETEEEGVVPSWIPSDDVDWQQGAEDDERASGRRDRWNGIILQRVRNVVALVCVTDEKVLMGYMKICIENKCSGLTSDL